LLAANHLCVLFSFASFPSYINNEEGRKAQLSSHNIRYSECFISHSVMVQTVPRLFIDYMLSQLEYAVIHKKMGESSGTSSFDGSVSRKDYRGGGIRIKISIRPSYFKTNVCCDGSETSAAFDKGLQYSTLGQPDARKCRDFYSDAAVPKNIHLLQGQRVIWDTPPKFPCKSSKDSIRKPTFEPVDVPVVMVDFDGLETDTLELYIGLSRLEWSGHCRQTAHPHSNKIFHWDGAKYPTPQDCSLVRWNDPSTWSTLVMSCSI
jgi:hypothetical protein